MRFVSQAKEIVTCLKCFWFQWKQECHYSTPAAIPSKTFVKLIPPKSPKCYRKIYEIGCLGCRFHHVNLGRKRGTSLASARQSRPHISCQEIIFRNFLSLTISQVSEALRNAECSLIQSWSSPVTFILYHPPKQWEYTVRSLKLFCQGKVTLLCSFNLDSFLDKYSRFLSFEDQARLLRHVTCCYFNKTSNLSAAELFNVKT